MEKISLSKFEVTINNEFLKGKKPEEITQFVNESVVPVILSHLLEQPKPVSLSGEIRCTTDGKVRCEGKISFGWSS